MEDFSCLVGLVRSVDGLRCTISVVKDSFAFVECEVVDTGFKCFEVWNLRLYHKNQQLLLGLKYRFPHREEFGYHGWSFSNELMARKFFDGLVTHGRSDWIKLYRGGLDWQRLN